MLSSRYYINTTLLHLAIIVSFCYQVTNFNLESTLPVFKDSSYIPVIPRTLTAGVGPGKYAAIGRPKTVISEAER
ncbi:hypothetical protein KL920_002289 [Ogataea angusta]|nr:hypothetical protein KL920_002289 [Ogataea angusta]